MKDREALVRELLDAIYGESVRPITDVLTDLEGEIGREQCLAALRGFYSSLPDQERLDLLLGCAQIEEVDGDAAEADRLLNVAFRFAEESEP